MAEERARILLLVPKQREIAAIGHNLIEPIAKQSHSIIAYNIHHNLQLPSLPHRHFAKSNSTECGYRSKRMSATSTTCKYRYMTENDAISRRKADSLITMNVLLSESAVQDKPFRNIQRSYLILVDSQQHYNNCKNYYEMSGYDSKFREYTANSGKYMEHE
ncbi:hypothetical protein CAPTEDRAFT_198860 [Capitella teleta]|uniref:Uncharacterized protein n=1 Tax=Capitella teleta TaxID=283909 RepID=R7T910_CAPTE|nr:hypothetical protein CAPTEDRAFT_198860 [Capitella teleta]|eukprot:ELT87484.1 hypothetical protein CAPTEDRAFT_198860 [Capitella teleta]